LNHLQTLKILFIVLSTLMITSILFGVMAEDAMDMELKATDRILAAMFGSFMVIAINYVIYKLLAKIWK
jgi:uncharacterized membrane protein required for colicin V production